MIMSYNFCIDNSGSTWSSGAWGPGPNGPIVDPPLPTCSEGCRISDLLYAHNIMAGYSRTFDLILGCKTRNEFDAQPFSALSAK